MEGIQISPDRVNIKGVGYEGMKPNRVPSRK